MAGETAAAQSAASEHRNDVVLVGRLGAPAEIRTLPSGDEITTFRLVVDRPPRRRQASGRREPTVDTLDCSVAAAVDRRRVLGWAAGDVVRVEGALRRRFWRAGPSVLSRCEVQVARARRLARSA